MIESYLASPDDIKAWSHGEVTKPETLTTARSGRKRRLFDERIFARRKIGNANAANTKDPAAALSATSAASK